MEITNAMKLSRLCFAVFTLAVPVSLQAALAEPTPRAKVVAIQGGTVHTGTGDVLENAVVLIKKGKIAAIGTDVEIPEGAEVIDASSGHVFPGLIDADSQLLLEPSVVFTVVP